MHVLDDPGGLSPRAQAFLKRSGSRSQTAPTRLSTEYLRVPDLSGQLIPAPLDLVVRREGFAARFGGLRYDVRLSIRFTDGRRQISRRWNFDLDGWIRREPHGWSFGWMGEEVSSPVRYLVHTDGRFGVLADGPFLEVSPSVDHMIESHALMDEVADWSPVTGSALEAWVPRSIDEMRYDDTGALVVVPEASGPCEQWLLSDTMAVRLFSGWTGGQPRQTGVMAWMRDG